MTAEDFKDELAGIINNITGARLFFLVKEEQGYSIKISRVENAALQSITNGFVERLKNDIIENDDFTLPLLSNIDDRKNALYEFDYNEKPDEFNLLKTASLLPPNYQEFYIPNNNFIDVKAMAFVLSGNGKCVSLYKNKTNVTVLKNSNNMINFFMNQQGMLETFSEGIIKIDFGYDLLLFNDIFYIKNVKTLEMAMRFHDVIIEQANTAITALKQSLMIEDISHLEKSSAEISFSRKLAKIAKHSPVLGKIDVPTVVGFVSTHKFLSTVLEINENGDKFIVKTKASQKHFIKLLSDDYLESELTKILYDSLAKDRLQA